MSVSRRLLEEHKTRRAASAALIDEVFAQPIHERELVWSLLAHALMHEDRAYFLREVVEAVEGGGASRRRRSPKGERTRHARAGVDPISDAIDRLKTRKDAAERIVSAICGIAAGDRHDVLRRLVAAAGSDDLAFLLEELTALEERAGKRRHSGTAERSDEPSPGRPTRSKYRPVVVSFVQKNPQGLTTSAARLSLAKELHCSAELAERLLQEALEDGEVLYDPQGQRWYPLAANVENMVKHVVRHASALKRDATRQQIVDFVGRHIDNFDANSVVSSLEALCRTGEIKQTAPNKYAVKVGPIPLGGTPGRPDYTFAGVGVLTRHTNAETRLLTPEGQEVLSPSKSMREVIVDAMRAADCRPMSTRQIILEVQARDPRKKDASIKAEVARMLELQWIAIVGEAPRGPRGHTYVLVEGALPRSFKG